MTLTDTQREALVLLTLTDAATAQELRISVQVLEWLRNNGCVSAEEVNPDVPQTRGVRWRLTDKRRKAVQP